MYQRKVLLVSKRGVKALGYHTVKTVTGTQNEVSRLQPKGLKLVIPTCIESCARLWKVHTTERTGEV